MNSLSFIMHLLKGPGSNNRLLITWGSGILLSDWSVTAFCSQKCNNVQRSGSGDKNPIDFFSIGELIFNDSL